MEALPLFLDDVDMLPICRLRQVAIKVLRMVRNADCSRTLQNHFFCVSIAKLCESPCIPIGRGDSLKICTVWVRVPPGAPD